jgi:hypothetical protein
MGDPFEFEIGGRKFIALGPTVEIREEDVKAINAEIDRLRAEVARLDGLRGLRAMTGHAEGCECCRCLPEMCDFSPYRDALREMVEAWDVGSDEGDPGSWRRGMDAALAHARALLKEDDRG